MENQRTLFVAASFLIIGLMAGLLMNAEPTQNDSPAEPTVDEIPRVEVSVDDDPYLGDPEAPVTIVEFSDYQCPYCAKFAKEALEQIKTNYVDTGKVKFVYRDFPIPSHQDASMAAVAVECVADLGGNEAYFEMHDILFENMSEWSYKSNAKEIVMGYASNLGYDVSTCIDDPEMIAEVDDDYMAGRSYGVSGTPTVFVNGIKVVGAYPYEAFAQLIESEL